MPRTEVSQAGETQDAAEDHAAARAFAYGPWAKVRTIEDVRTNLAKAREALDTCKRVGDWLTPRKLLLASAAAAEVVVKAVEEVEKSESDVDKINLPQYQQLNTDLQTFIKDVSAFVEEKK